VWLTHIEADRLRNLKGVRLELPAGLTVIAGANGQGKTSLLEAVYVLATGRSFRTRRLDELVSWQGGPLRVAGAVESRAGRAELAVLVEPGSRRLLADGRELDLENYLGRVHIVDLTAERAQVLRGAPLERRRFLDRGIMGLSPELLRVLSTYRRALQQRNALLRNRRAGPGRHAEIDAWDERLVQAAVPLHTARREYAARLAAQLPHVERALFPGGELQLRYRPSPARAAQEEPARFADVFHERLLRGRHEDLAIGHTCSGPHRDELIVEHEGVDLRKYGSAGQVRAAMIALKLGKLSLLREQREEAALFLMDDFDIDLDELRASALAAFLQQGRFQALVATSKQALADRLGVGFMKVRMDGGMTRPV
jgi:DNA replication and repair protein RecF